ncbi:amino acid ABC transporter substrate-binding protein [Tumidithrix elongata RA019]|uniref:Amino acid ABC transporter substrate-binding protein n=1 Tax=Tumidithrix elongata BACA0141 TaxID=2716417 RepID=A0AAW9Q872_9CYAN|nr:amino acid ABC transporter substrate-binding protein [Tumidithrix elongata RA019]
MIASFARNSLKLFALAVCSSIAVFVLTACEDKPPQNGQTPNNQSGQNAGNNSASRLDVVLARGKLICGVSGELPGFSFVDQTGKYSGLDVDICKAIAAALFDNPDAVQYRNLNAKERFTALQTGEIDVLSRNTTWTLSRDTSGKMEFAPVVFYDGQGVMVRKDSNIKSLDDLKDASICAQSGTTTELNFADQMRKRNISYKPITFEEVNATFAAYQSGRCAAVTADRSALISRRTRLPNPDEHVVLDASISKEPLAPAVLNGDSKWFDTVKWIVYATMEAEELGITSKNLAEQAKSSNAPVKRFLGIEGSLGKDMGLSNDFAARVIKHVGNYGEIYDRNMGKDSKFNLPRGLNKLWSDGGLIYSPPFR